LDDAIPVTVLLSVVQSDGSMFHPQRQSLKKAFTTGLVTRKRI